MVAEVVIDVRHAHEEHHAAPELFEVPRWLRAQLCEHAGEIEVARPFFPVASLQETLTAVATAARHV
jgi:hypothetical protein